MIDTEYNRTHHGDADNPATGDSKPGPGEDRPEDWPDYDNDDNKRILDSGERNFQYRVGISVPEAADQVNDHQDCN